MASSELRTLHPRRAGIGDALNRMVPLADEDRRTAKLLRRIEIGEAVKR